MLLIARNSSSASSFCRRPEAQHALLGPYSAGFFCNSMFFYYCVLIALEYNIDDNRFEMKPTFKGIRLRLCEFRNKKGELEFVFGFSLNIYSNILRRLRLVRNLKQINIFKLLFCKFFIKNIILTLMHQIFISPQHQIEVIIIKIHAFYESHNKHIGLYALNILLFCIACNITSWKVVNYEFFFIKKESDFFSGI